MNYLCPVCQASVSEGTKYCPNCGSQIQPMASTQDQQYSSKVEQRQPTEPLGRSNDSWQPTSERFVPPTQVQSEQASWGSSTNAQQQPYQQQPYQQQPYQQQPYQPYSPTGASQQSGGKKRRNWGILALIVGVLLLITAAVGAVLSQQNSSSSEARRVSSIDTPTRTPRPTRTPEAGGGVNEATIEPTEDIEPTEEYIEPTAMARAQALPDASGDIIFYSYEESGLVSVPATGGTPTVLDIDYTTAFSYDEAEWSPDGTSMIIADRERNGAILLYGDRDGSNLEQISKIDEGMPYYVYWSPDNNKVAFVITDADDEDYSEQNIYVLEIATQSLTQVTEGGSVETTIEWSPDSNKIAYTIYNPEDYTYAPHTVDITTKQAQALPFDSSSPYWLNESALIYQGFCEDDQIYGVCAFDITNNTTTTILEIEGSETLQGISPDGRWLILENYSNSKAFVYDLSTNTKETVSSTVEYIYWHGWSPDSRFVVYSDYGSDSATYVYEVGTGNEPTLLYDQEYIAWLPAR